MPPRIRPRVLSSVSGSAAKPATSAVDQVAIPHEPARGHVIREGFDDLLGRPRSGGMLRDPHINNPPTVMGSSTSTNSTRPVRVGTVKKSIETSAVR